MSHPMLEYYVPVKRIEEDLCAAWDTSFQDSVKKAKCVVCYIYLRKGRTMCFLVRNSIGHCPDFLINKFLHGDREREREQALIEYKKFRRLSMNCNIETTRKHVNWVIILLTEVIWRLLCVLRDKTNNYELGYWCFFIFFNGRVTEVNKNPVIQNLNWNRVCGWTILTWFASQAPSPISSPFCIKEG